MKIKTNLYIQAKKTTFCKEFKISVSSFKDSSDQFGVVIDVDETEIEVECPNFSQEQFTNGHIEQLRKIREKHLAESHQKTKSLDEQIENLLAIENKVSS